MFQISPKNNKKKIFITLIVLGFVSTIIFVYKDTQPITFFRGTFQSIFESPRAFLYSLGKAEKDERVVKLQKEIEELQGKLVDYDLVKKDNEALRSQFDKSGETTRSMTVARIVGFLGENQQPNELIINAGRAQGVVNGLTVVAGEYLVGKIDEASDNYSSVITPYNPKFQVLAKLPQTGANGIIIGRGDLVLFDGVVITDELQEGGIVVTKGEVDKNGIGVVPDIMAGKIESISKRETAPFQNAQLKPLVDYAKLTNVFIITKM